MAILRICIAASLLTLMMGWRASASIIETDAFQNDAAYAVPAGEANLNIAGVASAGLLTGQEGTSSNVSLLSDGQNLTGVFSTPDGANPGTPVDAPHVVSINSNGTITYTFPSAINITGIDTYSEWRDSGRADQDYVVATSTDGVTFTPLHTVNFDSLSGDNVNGQVSLTSSTGILASNVLAVQFQFGTVQNGYVGYTELAVLSVPEPTSMALLGLGLAGAWIARRRFAR